MKNFQKNSKNTSRCDESNGVKFSQKFVHLVQFAGFEVKKNMQTKVYKYNIKVVQKRVRGFIQAKICYTYSFSILCGHLNLNKKN